MVRLNPQLARVALFAATLMIAAPHGNAQAPPSPSTAPAPAASNGPLHWRAQGNTVQPVTPSPQPGAGATTPQAAPPGAQPSMAPQAAAPTAQPAAVPTSPHGRSAPSSKAQVAAAPQTPAPAPTLDQLPPTPPQVRFQNGELTIDAHNATLGQVLRAVQSQTGASIDMPATAGSVRVGAQLGPGRPHDVLNTLLNGSKFDYVILGVAGDPGGVQKIILTPRQGGSTVATAQNNPAPQPQPEEPDEGPVAESEPEQTPEPPPPPPGGFRRPIVPTQQPPDQQNGISADQQQNGAKTPEQLMQELQQMQQQQQQYQEQLNPANRQPQ